MENTEIGKKIKARRKELKITQKDLAQKVGIAEVTLRQYEAGLYMPKIETRAKLARALQCKYEDLFPSETFFSLMTAKAIEPVQSAVQNTLDSAIKNAFKVDPVEYFLGSDTTELPKTDKPTEASPLPSVDTSDLTDHEIRELQIYRDFLIFRRGQSAESSPDNNPDT